MTLPKVKGVRYYIAGLLMLVTMVNYIDRTCLSVTGPTLKEKLSINEQQFSYIIMCFQFSYLIMQPLFGRIMDWLNIKKGFSLAIVWWSVANMLHAFARGPFALGIFRSLLGVGEAGNFPGIAKTAAEWFPPRERTMATGIANIGSGTGALVATPFVAWIIFKWGWQEAFVITGAIGLVWLVFWLLLYHTPEKHPLITVEELAYIRHGQQELNVEDTAADKSVWKLVLKQRNFWGIACARFLSEPAWQFFSYWIPLYLVTERGMNLKQIAYFAWVPFLAADLGSFVGGLLSPMFQKFGLSVITARKAAMTTAACMMPFALFIAKAPSGGWAILWFSCAAFGHNCISATLLTLPADLFPKRTVATANGLSGSVAHFGGMLFTFTVGMLVMNLGYTPIFAIIAVLDLVGAALLWSLVRTPSTSKNRAELVP
jgi:ACS family hexuronate transporter-like MFS transporter